LCSPGRFVYYVFLPPVVAARGDSLHWTRFCPHRSSYLVPSRSVRYTIGLYRVLLISCSFFFNLGKIFFASTHITHDISHVTHWATARDCPYVALFIRANDYLPLHCLAVVPNPFWTL